MIEISVNFNADDLMKRINLLDVKHQRNINKAVQEAALLVQSTAKKEIQRGSRTGRTYKRRGVTHVASAPGEYPKSDTGRLVSSIRVNYGPFQADVGSDLKYSEYLELGTKFMQPRPWLLRSEQVNELKIKQLMDNALKGVI